MGNVLARNWGWVALRGVAALLFGLLTLFNPAITHAVLVFWFGAFAIADGVLSVVSALAHWRGEPHWVALLVGGLAGIVIGVLTFVMPGFTATVLVYLIAAWAIVRGVAEIATAIRLRELVTGEWMLALAGVLSVLFGAAIAVVPAAGALAIVLWIGVWAIVLGVVLLGLALRLRSWEHRFGADGSGTPRTA